MGGGDGEAGALETECSPTTAPSGMGVSTVTAARILKGQLHHNPGEETRLEMDKFPYVALSKVRGGWGARRSWGDRRGQPWRGPQTSRL